jgi:hypothetical protein
MRAALLLVVTFLSGCITMPETGGWLTNHVVCTVDDNSCMTASRWGPVALTGDLNRSESKAILEGRRARDKLRSMEVTAKP